MKDLKKQVDQVQTVMKKHMLNLNFVKLYLEEEESLPLKFKFPYIKKYSTTGDPHLH